MPNRMDVSANNVPNAPTRALPDRQELHSKPRCSPADTRRFHRGVKRFDRPKFGYKNPMGLYMNPVPDRAAT
jgi:hypothetical protein